MVGLMDSVSHLSSRSYKSRWACNSRDWQPEGKREQDRMKAGWWTSWLSQGRNIELFSCEHALFLKKGEE